MKGGRIPTRPSVDLIRYYSEAGPDYGAWSPGFHMHFGFWRRGLNPFRREPMLEEMSRQVLTRLELDPDAGHRVLDAGCGLGTSTRVAAVLKPGWALHGVTIVPSQVAEAHRRTSAALAGRVHYHEADYRRTPFEDASFDGVFALESACHDAGPDKAGFVAEAARLLRPGGRLVVADGFLKGSAPLNPLLRRCVRIVCRNWALETFAEVEAFAEGLRAHGLTDVRVEEISWRIAPSVMHVPWVTVRFLAHQLVASRLRLTRVRWGHLRACALSPVVGLARRRFGYFLVSARRSPHPGS